MMVLEERPAHVPFSLACDALGLNRSTVYARQRRSQQTPDPAKPSPRLIHHGSGSAIFWRFTIT